MRTSSRLIAILALAGCSFTSSLGGGTRTSAPSGAGKLVMIDLVGKTPDEAKAALEAAGFAGSFEVNRRPLECEGAIKQAGRIDCQLPDPGEIVDRHAIINVDVPDGPRQIAGALVRTQLVKVRGMTIPEARAYLKSIGHDGEVAVFEQPVFSNSCGAQKVCDVEPESGTGVHDRVTLVINPGSRVEISLPP